MMPGVWCAALLVAVTAVTAVRGAAHDRARGGGRPSVLPPVVASPDGAERTAQYWIDDAQAEIHARVGAGLAGAGVAGGRARRVVMFLGDGMSVATLAAARTLRGQRAGRPGEESRMSFERFPTVGLAKTYCVDAQIADSACTATAYLCGVKNNYGTTGVTAAVPRSDCAASLADHNRVQSIAEWALERGWDAGIVTTTRVTHASPSGVYAKVADRDWENDAKVREDGHDPAACEDIAAQMVQRSPGNRLKVILGGGRREFLPVDAVDEEGAAGRRTDGRDLLREWRDDKAARNLSHRYVGSRDQLLAAAADPPDYLLGLFEGTHMHYNMEAGSATEPSLAEMTEVAIKMLGRNDEGFFLFVEGGRIDHAHHDNLVEFALDETLEMDAAVQRATELLSEDDSLVVVTSDHSHVMAFNGYTRRGGDVLGPSDERDELDVPYMTLSYTNGPGWRPHADGKRVDVTQESNYRAEGWMSHSDAPREYETHGGEDVAVFAWGARHQLFSGLYEQSHVPHRMAFAACLGPGEHACSAAPRTARTALGALAALLLCIGLFNH